MGPRRRMRMRSATVACTVASVLLSGCRPFQLGSEVLHWGHGGLGTSAEVCDTPTVEALAHDLDKLEAHIERYGSVVAKQPDVWGQARLTKHRQEFEAQMAAQLSQFDFTLQGSVAMSDQAYFADALALSAAAAPRGRAGSTTNSSTSSSSSSAAADPTLPLPALPDAFGAFSNVTRNAATLGPKLEFAGAKTGITVEPAVLLDQRARFLNHLQELRRINEGDDTSDAPGYALNLVRIPVSVLPGKFTDRGYGAEVTITMTPYLSDELLPTTFRNLVINDIVDQLGYPITEFINNPGTQPYFQDLSSEDVDNLIDLLQSHPWNDFSSECEVDQEAVGELTELRWKPGLEPLFARQEWSWVDGIVKLQQIQQEMAVRAAAENSDEAALEAVRKHNKRLGHDVENWAEYKKKLQARTPDDIAALEKQTRDWTKRAYSNIKNVWLQIPVPASKSRRARMPFPHSELFDVFAWDFDRVVVDAYRGLAKQRFAKPTTDPNSPVVLHLPDVQGYLQEELSAAYKFLAEKGNEDLWLNYCTPALVQAIRAHDDDALEEARLQFKTSVGEKRQAQEIDNSTRAVLAWAIIVESALLTDQLVQDMRESAAAKNCGCVGCEAYPYFLPCPPPEAREAFNNYVRCRWPIHVFALDPAAQQQNIVDTFSGRREMQLAMSMAFVSGRLSANNMMRFARRIEYDFATIDLNGTEIGFSHGNETFGWRFYPRFQTPDIESNGTVFFRDLLIGGPSKDTLLKQRRLEPGIRECYAIVIMPSFVPYATFNVSSNWFALTNPKCKEMDSTDAMRLSKLAKCIEVCGPRTTDGACYRDADLQHLIEKAKQLETRLPFQNTMVQIPYENTLGGFAMFNTGVTDLAPELVGWYGTEAVDYTKPTTVFLVGNHFSVHQTEVIAGGQSISTVELLSRQVMQVTIPAKPLLVGDKDYPFVDVQLATPYGVTQHLLIPVANAPAAGAPADNAPSVNSVAWKTAEFDLAFIYAGLGITPPPTATDPRFRPANLVISPGTIDTNSYDTVDITLKFSGPSGDGPFKITSVPFKQKKGGYVVPGDQLAATIFSAVGSYLGPEETNPAAPMTATATVTFKSSSNAAPDVDDKISNTLTVNFFKAPTAGNKATD